MTAETQRPSAASTMTAAEYALWTALETVEPMTTAQAERAAASGRWARWVSSKRTASVMASLHRKGLVERQAYPDGDSGWVRLDPEDGRNG